MSQDRFGAAALEGRLEASTRHMEVAGVFGGGFVLRRSRSAAGLDEKAARGEKKQNERCDELTQNCDVHHDAVSAGRREGVMIEAGKAESGVNRDHEQPDSVPTPSVEAVTDTTCCRNRQPRPIHGGGRD